jgi:sporulation protein YlmC with PRC-barrel domain
MFAKTITAGLLGAALLTSAAYAQNPSPSAASPSASSSSSSSMSHQGQWRSSKLIGVNVYNASNESLGEITELLTDSSGKIQAAVIGVGGFLGMGERNVAIPFEQLKFSNEPRSSTTASSAANRPAGTAGSGAMAPSTTTGASTSSATNTSGDQWYPDHAVLNVTKEQLKSMPEFKYST